jgi:hypothetical protein
MALQWGTTSFDTYDWYPNEKKIEVQSGDVVRLKVKDAPKTVTHFAAGLIVYRVPPGSVIAHEVARFTNSQDAVSFAQEKSK